MPFKRGVLHSPAIHCNTEHEINFTQPPAMRLYAEQLRNATFADSSRRSWLYTRCSTVHCKNVHLYTIKKISDTIICEMCIRLNIYYRCIERTSILFQVLFFYMLPIMFVMFFFDGILCFNFTLPYHSLLVMFCKDLVPKSLCIHILPHIFFKGRQDVMNEQSICN